ncbi:MAG TPA: DUF5667 domain-containing protein [Patescibacteria group bacterium]
MKKFLIVLGLIFFAVGFTSTASAQENTVNQNEITPTQAVNLTVTPSPIMQLNAKYQLAYPGLLPDSPLYILKVLRDKIMAMLITNPSKKVNFYLLQADKGIAMIPLLVQKNEMSLAKTTALKAENNYTLITFVYKSNNTKPDAATYKKLLSAANRHQEVLAGLLSKVSADDAKVFQQVINFSKTNVEELQKVYNGIQ